VISESLAHALFGAGPSIGRRLWLSGDDRPVEIIGVVGDIKHLALDSAVLPTLYRAALQTPSRSNVVVVRSMRPDADVVATVREEVARLDRNLPVYRVRSMEAVVAASPGIPARRVLATVLGGFSSLALVLSACGLFGVVAHEVASRRKELALRVAIGADPVHIMRTAVRPITAMMGAGLIIGGALSFAAARALRDNGFALEGPDVMALGVPAATLLVAAAIAVLPAARRAAQVDPHVTLQSE
jgi:ABC-type antimicrobial peptide transport system permease subunit